MATMNVKDAAGSTVAIEKPLAPARAAAAASRPVVLSTEDLAAIGSLTETAPASDTASSGLNGRLQRVAQRLTSLITLFPTALGQGTMAQSLPVVLASDQAPRHRARYRCADRGVVLTANGVFLHLVGSATKTVRVTRIQVSGTHTTAAVADVEVYRRSTAGSGGTTKAINGVAKMDTADGAATAVLTCYTAPPTAGTPVAAIETVKFSVPAPTAAALAPLDFIYNGDEGLVLRGTSDWITVGTSGYSAYTGASWDFMLEWIEE